MLLSRRRACWHRGTLSDQFVSPSPSRRTRSRGSWGTKRALQPPVLFPPNHSTVLLPAASVFNKLAPTFRSFRSFRPSRRLDHLLPLFPPHRTHLSLDSCIPAASSFVEVGPNALRYCTAATDAAFVTSTLFHPAFALSLAFILSSVLRPALSTRYRRLCRRSSSIS